MAYSAYVDINPADEQKFFKALSAQDRFSYSRLKKKTGLFSRHKRFVLTSRSLLPQISEIWATLTQDEKDDWTDVGVYCGLNGWRSFVAEMSIRLKMELSTDFIPSIYHQSWFGHIAITSPATEIHIAQYHPASYYVRRKVYGVKGLYQPVAINEPISLPLQIGMSYKSNLTATGGTQRLRFYANVRSSYQGVDRENILEIPLSAVADWNIVTATLSSTLGYVIGYTLYIEIFGYTGNLYFDNVKAIHGSVNWVRDHKCSDINASFSNTYYQVPKNWVALELPSGAVYDSDYLDFL